MLTFDVCNSFIFSIFDKYLEESNEEKFSFSSLKLIVEMYFKVLFIYRYILWQMIYIFFLNPMYFNLFQICNTNDVLLFVIFQAYKNGYLWLHLTIQFVHYPIFYLVFYTDFELPPLSKTVYLRFQVIPQNHL